MMTIKITNLNYLANDHTSSSSYAAAFNSKSFLVPVHSSACQIIIKAITVVRKHRRLSMALKWFTFSNKKQYMTAVQSLKSLRQL